MTIKHFSQAPCLGACSMGPLVQWIMYLCCVTRWRAQRSDKRTVLILRVMCVSPQQVV